MKATVGILAHVDAGKTTFSEQVLFQAHAVKRLGRVDHQDAFLDTHPLERRRGITIFSGIARFPLGDKTIYWLDTPGHADFSAEMERAVNVMDYAVLLISCAEGVQSHTETVWQLLRDYGVPTLLFLNKTDRAGADPEATLRQIRSRLSEDVVDLRAWQETGEMDDALREEIASRDEALLEALFSGGFDQVRWIRGLREQLRARACFPVMAGAALEGRGVAGFLRLMDALLDTDWEAKAQEPFAARVYQVRHDEQGTRLCFLKLLSGRLRLKDELPGEAGKVNELRLYHGEKYRAVGEASAGDLVAVPGLEAHPGDTLGVAGRHRFRLEPMMAADVRWDESAVPPYRMMQALRTLEEEEPSLAVAEEGGRIAVRVMGGIQLEVLRQLLAERFGFEVTFGPCRVLYKETIAAPVVGIGHYEPLRHYAEVHLRLSPGPRGSGVTFRSLCHVDTLALSWQRLIETHVFEKQHKGVLTGAPLTDVSVELLAGRAHLKHTEGGDFRQAVYRAIRNGLMQAQSVLLEPVCGFSLRAPAVSYGTLAGALGRMQATLEPPQYEGEEVLMRGEAPYADFAAWQADFLAVTRGCGALRVWMSRYAPCRNAAAVIAAAAYNPLADDTPDSVFCQHGAGFTVAWDHVREWAHVTSEA